MPAADVLDGGDVLGEAEAVVDVQCLEILQVLDDLRGVEVDEHCVFLNLEPVDLEEGVAAFLQALESLSLLHPIKILRQNNISIIMPCKPIPKASIALTIKLTQLRVRSACLCTARSAGLAH